MDNYSGTAMCDRMGGGEGKKKQVSPSPQSSRSGWNVQKATNVFHQEHTVTR